MPHNKEQFPPNSHTSAEQLQHDARKVSGLESQAYTNAMVFRDLDGAPWFAHEVAGEELGQGPRDCLLLVSARQVRRISEYPADWRRLTSAALLELHYTTLSRDR